MQTWIAPQGFQDHLIKEFKFHQCSTKEIQNLDHLFYGPDQTYLPVWVQDIWDEAKIVEIESVSDAAKQLRKIEKNWFAWQENFFHRTNLILGKLPIFQIPKIQFAEKNLKPDFGCFALLDSNRMIYSIQTKNPVPCGYIQFLENKTEPPSRAYLKLWEIFTRLDIYPKPGDLCLDVGACPGGWSWVLLQLGCQVFAVDRSGLSDAVMKMPGLKFKKGDAFKVLPQDSNHLNWLVSDLICEPEKLYDWIRFWYDSKKCNNFICTLKMKGTPDFKTTKKFLDIPGSQIVHLYHNKNELTWINLSQSCVA